MIARRNALTYILVAMSVFIPAQLFGEEEEETVDIRLTFVQAKNGKTPASITEQPEFVAALEPISKIDARANAASIRGYGDTLSTVTLRTKLGHVARWRMGGRSKTMAIRASGERFGEEMPVGRLQDFGVRLELRVSRLPDNRYRIFVHPKTLGVDYQNSVEAGGLLHPMLVSGGHRLYADIAAGESVVLTGLMGDEMRRILRQIPDNTKSSQLERLIAARDEKDSSRLLVIVTPEFGE